VLDVHGESQGTLVPRPLCPLLDDDAVALRSIDGGLEFVLGEVSRLDMHPVQFGLPVDPEANQVAEPAGLDALLDAHVKHDLIEEFPEPSAIRPVRGSRDAEEQRPFRIRAEQAEVFVHPLETVSQANMALVLDHALILRGIEALDPVRVPAPDGGHRGDNEVVHRCTVSSSHLDPDEHSRIPSLDGFRGLNRKSFHVDQEENLLPDAMVRAQRRGDRRLAEPGSKNGELAVAAGAVAFKALVEAIDLVIA